MKTKIFIAAAVIISSSVQAQDSTKTLNEVIITANKTLQKQSTTGKVITVISKDVIEKSVGKTVAQLLNEQAGVTVSGALNNAGTNQSLYLRGGATGRTLVLVDGIPVTDPSLINNEFDLNLIALNDVERIEICKGAQSTLYGSDAVAGVVNIITVKNDVSKPFNVKATLAAGSLNTFKGNAQLYGKTNGFTYSVRYSKLTTDGFSAANDKNNTGTFDKDGYKSDAASAMVKYDFSKHFAARSFIQYSKYKTDLDAGVFADSKDYTSKNKSLIAGGGLQYKSDAVTITANYQYSDITRNLLDDSTDAPGSLSRNDYFGKSQFVEVFSNIKLSKNFSFLQGADYRNNRTILVSFGTYPASPFGPAGTYGSKVDSIISQASLYGSLMYTGLKGKLNIDLGGRLNVNSRYGSNSSYSFNPSFKISEQVRLLGSVSTAYKTPTIYQLYSSAGNRNLKVEESKSYEFGVQVDLKNISNRLVYFYRDIENGIDYNNLNFRYFNINSQIVRGLEYEVKANPIKGLTITANYTYLAANEYSQSRLNFKDTGYTYLLRRPKSNLNVTAGYQIMEKLYASVSGKYVSKRMDVGGYKVADISLPDYFILSAYAEYNLTRMFKVFADVQNLGNRKFFDINGYNSIPLIFTGGVTFRF